MPNMKFVRDGWGHKAGDVVEKTPDFALVLEQEGYAVETTETPKVERAVAPEPEKRTAKLER
jgi:hypothetical protein